jgi:hypothetical protein
MRKSIIFQASGISYVICIDRLTKIIMDNLDDLIWTVADYLRAWGFEVPEDVKQRDAREPGRRQKIILENKFYRATRAYFSRLAAKAQRRLELHDIFYPRKAIDLDSYIGTDFFNDEEYDADVIRLLLQGVGEGADLFSQQVNIPLDYSGVNKNVLAWAKKQSGKIVKGVDKTSRDLIKQAVSLFVETPGFTIGDVMGMLPFDEERALRVAVTETTRAYSKGNQIGAEQLKSEFPDVMVVETWFTNNDDLVCPLCGPLNETEVEQGDGFYGADDSGYQDGYPPRHVNCRCWISYTTRISGEINNA